MVSLPGFRLPLPKGWLALAGGAFTGVVAAALATALSGPLVLLLFAACAIVIPTLLVREFTLYWLWGYLFFLPFEASKRVTGLGRDPEELINAFGLPPATHLGVKIFPTDLVLVPLLVVWLFWAKRSKLAVHLPKPAYFLIAYLIWATLSSLLKAQQPFLAVAQLVQEYKFLVVLLFFVSLFGVARLVGFVTGALLVTLAMEVFLTLSLFAMGHTRDSLAESLSLGIEHEYEFLRGQEKGLREGEGDPELRASGTFGAASHLAMWLQLLLPLPLALAAVSDDLKRRLGYLLLFLLSAGSLYLTLSRAGLLGLVTGTSTCIWLLWLRGHLHRRGLLVLAYVALAFIALQVPILYGHLATRPYTFWHRFYLFREGFSVIAANPVLGVGANNSTAARLEFAKRTSYESLPSTAIVSYDNLYPIHNQYIVVAAETGLVGFALGGAFFLLVAARAFVLSRSPDAFHAALATAILSGYVGLGFQLQGDHFVGNAQHAVLAIEAALVLALSRRTSDATSPRPDATVPT